MIETIAHAVVTAQSILDDARLADVDLAQLAQKGAPR